MLKEWSECFEDAAAYLREVGRAKSLGFSGGAF